MFLCFTMSSRVRVLSITHVHPAQTTEPSRPPHAADDHKLSFLDVIHVAKIPIQRLFFFDGPDLPPFPSVVSTLQSSLSATLAVFLPLAGKLTYRPASDEVVIDCSPAAVSCGVKFVEAEYSGGADDMRRLASEDEHDTEGFMQLVPELEANQLPTPVLSVQVTRSAAAGSAGADAVAVGVSMLHAVADGQAVWQFMRAWSTASREGSLAAPWLVPPTFDRTAIRHPRAEELSRELLRFFAPVLPLVSTATTNLQ